MITSKGLNYILGMTVAALLTLWIIEMHISDTWARKFHEIVVLKDCDYECDCDEQQDLDVRGY